LRLEGPFKDFNGPGWSTIATHKYVNCSKLVFWPRVNTDMRLSQKSNTGYALILTKSMQLYIEQSGTT
jgi:hypothetical protein